MKHLSQFIQRVIHKMGCQVVVYHSAMQEARPVGLAKRSTHLLLCNISKEAHLVQYLQQTVVCSPWIQKGVKCRRRSRNTRQHSRLRNIKLGGSARTGCILQVEVNKCSSISPICLLAVIDSVEVHRE